jgi:uncharacterized membrane protein YeaQ/YmgE (transglycosylase-associated protein family)
MNTFMWILAGGALGWISFNYLNANVDRGMVTSVIIGMVGGLIGGNLLAPLFANAVAEPGVFSPLALLVAAASAGACLIISNMVHKRFGI